MMFEKHLAELQDEQRNVVQEYSRCVVRARPGTGKTHTLALKLAYLLSYEVKPPYRIACITYMNDAVAAIRDRLETFGIEDDDRLLIGTVHQFCLTAILYPFKDIFLKDLPAQLTIADNETTSEIAGSSRNRGIISQLRRKIALRSEGAVSRSDRVVVESYVSNLRERGLIDFDDIAISAYKLVNEHSVVRDYLLHCYPWLVVDEYQDLGSIFNTIVSLLIDHRCLDNEIKFLIVGDPNQSIYGFQGATPHHLESLSKRDDVQSVELKITRRCLPHIVKLANRLVQDPIENFAHIDDGGRTPHLINCKTGESEQIDYIANIIAAEKSAGRSLGQVAVLCRGNPEVEKIGSEIQKRGHQIDSPKDLKIYSNRTPIVRLLEDMAGWAYRGIKSGKPRFHRVYQDFKRLIADSGIDIPPRNELDLYESFFDHLLQTGGKKVYLRNWLHELEEDPKLYFGEMIEAFRTGEKYLADAFVALKEGTSAGGKLERLTVEDLSLFGRSAESVFVSTVHGSKGLEFDTVIMPRMEQGHFPTVWAQDLDEERRILYVGVTRARNDIYFLYSNVPSEFLNDMMLL